jgi:hypothetical protein
MDIAMLIIAMLLYHEQRNGFTPAIGYGVIAGMIMFPSVFSVVTSLITKIYMAEIFP